MSDEYYKLPRLYSEEALAIQVNISLPTDQVHYLRNVMRRSDGDNIRLFNGRDGEFTGSLSFEGKKKANVHIDKL